MPMRGRSGRTGRGGFSFRTGRTRKPIRGYKKKSVLGKRKGDRVYRYGARLKIGNRGNVPAYRRRPLGTHLDSQYVGKFKGPFARRKYPDKYCKYGYKENVETYGNFGGIASYPNGPGRMVVQAVNQPRMFQTVVIAFLRHLMKKYYNHEYNSIDSQFRMTATANYEKPYSLRFVWSVRTAQAAATTTAVTYVIPGTATLEQVATDLVNNIFTSSNFGFGVNASSARHWTSISMIDRINAIEVSEKNVNLDHFFKVHYWSKVACRLQNVTAGNGASAESTDNINVRPLHGNIIFSKGNTPKVRNDNTDTLSLVPFTYEDVPNGVILPKTYLIDAWYRTIQGPDWFNNPEKCMNISLGAGQIKDFTLWYKNSMKISDFIAYSLPGNLTNSFVGSDGPVYRGLNRNALVQLEKFVDVQVAPATVVVSVNYHCEWEMGAVVTSSQLSYMPKGYTSFTEDDGEPTAFADTKTIEEDV